MYWFTQCKGKNKWQGNVDVFGIIGGRCIWSVSLLHQANLACARSPYKLSENCLNKSVKKWNHKLLKHISYVWMSDIMDNHKMELIIKEINLSTNEVSEVTKTHGGAKKIIVHRVVRYELLVLTRDAVISKRRKLVLLQNSFFYFTP